MILITKNSAERTALRFTSFMFAVFMFVGLFNEKRNILVNCFMPDWYQQFGDYLYLALAITVICKAIWKVSPGYLLLHILIAAVIWLLPYGLKINQSALQYPIIFLMYATPLSMTIFLHKKPIYHKYIEQT